MRILRDGLGNPASNVDKNNDEADHRQSPGEYHQSSVVLLFTGKITTMKNWLNDGFS